MTCIALPYIDMKVVENKRSLLSLPPLISQNTPWLILSHGDQGEKQTFYSISEDQYYTRMIPEMENKIILPSSSSLEWMVLMDYDDGKNDYILFNVGTLEKIQLPFDMDDPYAVLMTATPPNGHIVFMKAKGNHEECIFQFCCPVFRLDSSVMAWVEVEDMGEYAIFIDNQFCGICCLAADDSGIRTNSIYHIPERDGDEYMYVFDLKEGSTTTYLPCGTLSRQFQSSKWMMLPTIKQLEDLKA
ncbi:hypothetical protein CCACVL1_12116 [Corchorus capsularis]|uniref:KIB1-4 beta-propeller domain-containing protein n=1 Tax=Corchorus capsularis TaxID=210143 RepID=A0A1R3IHL0_COCAP|nr:hypothetical protein CCACVL1_12116 [Corchorus capsularis]